MPEDHEQYYGFTQFAIELNELEEGLKPLLPLIDTRFRPDQRYTHNFRYLKKRNDAFMSGMGNFDKEEGQISPI